MNTINSMCRNMGTIALPFEEVEKSMIPFELKDLSGLPEKYVNTVKEMLKDIKDRAGLAFLTVHGKVLKKGDTHRRPGAHIDGNYVNHVPGEDFISFGTGGGNGWKVGDDGITLTEEEHNTSYNNDKGGIILATSEESSECWIGEFEGVPDLGGDCTHIDLGKSEPMKANTIYYGNNRFIHNSLPASKDMKRIMYRITLPQSHTYEKV